MVDYLTLIQNIKIGNLKISQSHKSYQKKFPIGFDTNGEFPKKMRFTD